MHAKLESKIRCLYEAFRTKSRFPHSSYSSMPSPTYQCTNARLAYISSNLWSMFSKQDLIDVLFEMFSTARAVGAMSESSGWIGSCELTPCLKPVGFQSTTFTDGFALIVATDAFMSLTTTSPRYSRQTERYWLSGPRGSHFTRKFSGLNAAAVI